MYRSNAAEPAPCIKCANVRKDRFSKKRVPAAVTVKLGPAEPPKPEPAKSELRIVSTLTVGGISVEVDASNLARTLGCGPWGYGQGLVDKWSDAVWTALLKHLKLPCEPLDREVASQPVKRLVQRLWYEAIHPEVLEKPAFAERDAEAEETYERKHAEVKEQKTEAAERRASTPAFGRTSKTYYEPTAELKKSEGAGMGGQQKYLAQAFARAKWGRLTTQEATDGMVASGLQTTTKPERIAGFYLAQWCKKGLLGRVQA
jgi:hypothetical protein